MEPDPIRSAISELSALTKLPTHKPKQLRVVDVFEGIYDVNKIFECFGEDITIRLYNMFVNKNDLIYIRMIIGKVQIRFTPNDRYSDIRDRVDRLLQLTECSKILEIFGMSYGINSNCNVIAHYQGHTIVSVVMCIGNSTIKLEINNIEDLAPILKHCGFMPICKIAQKDS